MGATDNRIRCIMHSKTATIEGVTRTLTRPPGPKPRPLLGLFREFRKQPADFLERAARQYGDLAFFPLGPQNIYLASHPDFVQEILVTRQNQFKKSRMLERARVLLGEGLLTSEGNLHLRQRRLVQPAFHRDRLISYAAVMVECAAQCRERWTRDATLDLSVEMAHLTLAIVARTLFSANVDSEADEIGRALSEVFKMFELILLPYSDWIEKLPLPPIRRFHRARALLDSIIYRLIAERRADGNRDTGDLLSMLLAAQDEDGSVMTDQQIRDEALTLFVAGHETTAVAITWAWYLLSQNPEAESLFHAELDRVLAGRLPTFEDLPRLRYAEGVFAETLRLYPPAWGIGRRALADVEIAGYTIPAGSIVVVSPWVVHRDPRWFHEPLKFSPERWLAENTSRPKFAYFPFGGGTRICIGERFALAEGVLLLATLGQRWRFRLESGHRVETRPLITLRAKYGMRMTAVAAPEPRQ
jgi:cytochrome P450